MGIKLHKDLAIIIVTYNSQYLLDDCLNSIIKKNDINSNQIEVIVVDNSSGTNATEIKKIVENHKICNNIQTKYIHNAANLGYGQGNNVGIDNCNSKIICIMNPDVRFDSPLFKDVKLQFQDKNLGLLGYKQIGGFNLSYYLKPEFQIPVFSPLFIKLFNKINFFHSKYLYLSGALLFISKDKFEKIGLFDQEIFMYYEEPDISNRFLKNNNAIKFVKNKSYFHLVGKRSVFSKKSFTNEVLSLQYYLNKFGINSKKYVLKYTLSQKFKIVFAKILNKNETVIKVKSEIQVVKKILKLKIKENL
ncbi:glycosyltransferase [Flavobacterium psychrophilum]|uniref:glycosyltransferase n=1 Tax=Flavobacterium psychrophilum TaxID=96345 RepID=UPI001D08B27D|nr:glycosyltransferase [Flavobacterium psychrophilum]MCB5981801.1 glycosyltransferase [Flavobacterium psychrophilum]MCB5984439.1 glycosyltransferase [Flavobacterium psychrophilum]